VIGLIQLHGTKFWEASSSTANQEILLLLCRTRRRTRAPPLDPILNGKKEELTQDLRPITPTSAMQRRNNCRYTIYN
jgi:hypothetical protein